MWGGGETDTGLDDQKAEGQERDGKLFINFIPIICTIWLSNTLHMLSIQLLFLPSSAPFSACTCFKVNLSYCILVVQFLEIFLFKQFSCNCSTQTPEAKQNDHKQLGASPPFSEKPKSSAWMWV